MDQIFDRLGNLLKTTLGSDTKNDAYKASYSDPDLQDAWDELDDFLKSDSSSSSGSGPGFQSETFSPSTSAPQKILDSYKILGVVPETSTVDIAKAYKALLLKHHPDRVAGDETKVAAATEKTKIINRAFQEIKSYRSTNR